MSDEDKEGDEMNEEHNVSGQDTELTWNDVTDDYPSLLRDIEDMYIIDKNNQRQEDNLEEHSFDVQFQYYMMLQSLFLAV